MEVSQEKSTFHDPLLDEFEPVVKSAEDEKSDEPSELPVISSNNEMPVTASKLIRRKSIGLGSVMAEIKEPETPNSVTKSATTEGETLKALKCSIVFSGSSLASDFDVEDFLDGELNEKAKDNPEEVDAIIQNYTKSLVYCGTDDSKEAVFAVFARHLPQDVKTNYNYDPAMTALLKVGTLEV